MIENTSKINNNISSSTVSIKKTSKVVQPTVASSAPKPDKTVSANSSLKIKSNTNNPKPTLVPWNFSILPNGKSRKPIPFVQPKPTILPWNYSILPNGKTRDPIPFVTNSNNNSYINTNTNTNTNTNINTNKLDNSKSIDNKKASIFVPWNAPLLPNGKRRKAISIISNSVVKDTNKNSKVITIPKVLDKKPLLVNTMNPIIPWTKLNNISSNNLLINNLESSNVSEVSTKINRNKILKSNNDLIIPWDSTWLTSKNINNNNLKLPSLLKTKTVKTISPSIELDSKERQGNIDQDIFVVLWKHKNNKTKIKKLIKRGNRKYKELLKQKSNVSTIAKISKKVKSKVKSRTNYYIVAYSQLKNIRYIESNDRLIGLEEHIEKRLVGDYKGYTYTIVSAIRLQSKKVLNYYEPTDLSVGLRLQLKGRLRGASKAKIFKKAWGQIRTHTFENVIDYAEKPIQTKWGIFGLKVFIL